MVHEEEDLPSAPLRWLDGEFSVLDGPPYDLIAKWQAGQQA